MTLLNKHLFSLACLFYLSANGYSQQQAVLPMVQSKLNEKTKELQEKLYVHTDKDFYTAGEIIWFKVYAMDALSNKPVDVSKVAYLEVLDHNNLPVSRVKIGMNEMGGDGSIQLPISVNSGYYTLRAYTNWMKNDGPATFFQKIITIVNPLKAPDNKQQPVSSAYNLVLYPEGGNLVEGLTSRIAYHITDNYGNGVKGKGYLVNQNNDTISIFSPHKFGRGTFNLTPRKQDQYKVVFITDDRSLVTKPINGINEKGYVMSVEEVPSGLKLTVSTNTKSGYPEIYLLGQVRHTVTTAKKAILENGISSFYINKSELGHGINQFTIFDNEQHPVGERLYFVQPASKGALTINTDQKKYGGRKQVNLFIDSLKSQQSSLSLSVYQVDSISTTSPADIITYTWLTSELKGDIEQPSYYFSPLTEEVKRAADYLMMTNGWRRFNWDTFLNARSKNDYLPELTGHQITARVTDPKSNLPVNEVALFLSIPGTSYKLYSALTNERGIAKFQVKDYYGASDIIVQATDLKDTIYRIEILSPFSETYVLNEYPLLALKPSTQHNLQTRSISMQTQHVYTGDSVSRFAVPFLRDTLPFYGRAQYNYKFDDYKRFTTMEEVLREYVREINVGVKGTGTSLRVKLLNEEDGAHYQQGIIVLVDGVPLHDPNVIFSYDPLKLKGLDIFTKNYVIGPTIFHALANFTSYQGNFEGFEPSPNAVTIDYEGLLLQRQFYSPEYSTEERRQSRIPDFRTTLYWTPDVSSKKISFYTGDNKGSYIAVIQGLDATGQPLSATTEFKVE